MKLTTPPPPHTHTHTHTRLYGVVLNESQATSSWCGTWLSAGMTLLIVILPSVLDSIMGWLILSKNDIINSWLLISTEGIREIS
jgi:hypothetical protein